MGTTCKSPVGTIEMKLMHSIVPTGLLCSFALFPALKCRAKFISSLTGRSKYLFIVSPFRLHPCFRFPICPTENVIWGTGGFVRGKVYIVGAGPGDPRLITVRGIECLHMADVVVYDRLVDPKLLDEAPIRSERIYVGKEAGHHPWPQEQINELLLKHASLGKTVVRLKGGDPFIFGHGGEEAAFLNAHGIAYEIVPGVSSALAAPALAGIPLTYRGVSNSFAVATGHPAAPGSEVDFLSLYQAAGALVVLMGVGRRCEIAQRLMEGQVDPATPVAIVERGGFPDQCVTITNLKDILLEGQDIKPPAVIVIGNIVTLRESIISALVAAGGRDR
jgi:uroporphyrin-III C-methyltransferase